MGIQTHTLTTRGQGMRAAGLWTDQTMDAFLRLALAYTPHKTALVGYRTDRVETMRWTYAELADRVNRAAFALHRLGVRHADVVSLQLPNWWEFVVLTLACGRIGAVVNPLMHIFRERELTHMLGFAQSKVWVVPRSYRGHDFAAMAAGLKPHLPDLQQVVVVDGEGPEGFETLLQASGPMPGVQVPEGARPLEPDDLAVLMFTSGTTGAPKGVMHTSNTLVACMNALGGRFGLGSTDTYLASTPVGHMTGYVAVVLLGLRQGGTVVLQDLWDGHTGVEIMNRERVTYFAGSTPFLSDICEVVASGSPGPTHLNAFLCGGAPIPPALINRARNAMGIQVCSLWGMTEVLSGTLTEPQRAAEKSATTDGRVLEGMVIKIVDDQGRTLPVGQPGRLLVQGAQMFLGYYKQPELPAYDTDGWFDTGDMAYKDSEGYIRICGRTKDVLIRGGENIPVVEIEGVLSQHPSVLACSIVGYPDDRLGERACAFVVTRGNAPLSLADVQTHMTHAKVAKQYWPERLELLAQLPTTPSGKVQKFKLKDTLKTLIA